MVPNNNYSKWFSPKILILSVFLCSSIQNVFADVTNAGTMLSNFAATIPNLMSMVTAIAYVMGIFMIFRGIMALKQYGEQRTQMSSSHDLKGPLILMFVGTCLLYLPSSVQVGTSTFWQPNPYGYIQDTSQDQWTTIIQDAYMIIELIGTVAFIRGLLILSSMSGQGGQPGTFGRAMTYLIAGVLCINLYTFLHTINATLGLGSS